MGKRRSDGERGGERGREREKVGRGKGERQKTDEGEKKDDVCTEGVGGQREMRQGILNREWEQFIRC